MDAEDDIFSELRLCQDRDHDGVSQPAELLTLPELGVAGISLAYAEAREGDQHGNSFRYKAAVYGTPGSPVGMTAWDVWLVGTEPEPVVSFQDDQRNGAVSMAAVGPHPSCPDGGGGDPVPAAKWTCDASCNVQQIDRAHNARLASPDVAPAPRRGRHVPPQSGTRTLKFRMVATSGIATATVPKETRPRPTTTIS
jgi:hypothetical protein